MKINKESITRVIRNMQKGVEGECANILGSDYALSNVSKAWNMIAGDLHLIATHLMIKKATSAKFSSDELAIYNEGMVDILKFLEDSDTECYNKTTGNSLPNDQ